MPVSRSRRHPKKPTQTRRGDGDGRAMPAHARLVDTDGRVVGGIALRDGDEWMLVLEGRVAATTESAGLAIAMLRHTATLLAGAGREVKLDTSDILRARATREANTAGRSLEDYLDFLEAERAERARERADGGAAVDGDEAPDGQPH